MESIMVWYTAWAVFSYKPPPSPSRRRTFGSHPVTMPWSTPVLPQTINRLSAPPLSPHPPTPASRPARRQRLILPCSTQTRYPRLPAASACSSVSPSARAGRTLVCGICSPHSSMRSSTP